jgi:Family of unknown function (DUF5990)
MDMEFTFRLILQQPARGVDYGLQSGAGKKYQTVQCQRSSGGNIQFSFGIKVKGEPQKDPLPKFSGLFVQGPPGSRFIYVDIGTYAGQTDSEWSRRMKVPLSGIGWEAIEKMRASQDLLLEAIVPGKGTDGTPNCATVKPLAGWVIQLRA